MSNTRQHTRSASGFSPASTSFQQTGGESVRLSSMWYASLQGHMPYPDNHLGQPSVGFNPQHGYMPYPANNLGQPSTGYSPQRGYMPCPKNRQPVSFVGFNQDKPPFQQLAQRGTSWGQAPIQQSSNVPAHHHVEQSTAFAPFFSSVKIEPELNQQMQFPPMVEQKF